MPEDEISFEQLLTAVAPEHKEFINCLHKYLTDNGCKAKIELKSSGYFATYSYTKRSVANLLFRKKGMIVRIYGENVNKYTDFLDMLPDGMTKPIAAASVCKRLINPDSCNQKCSMGYDFVLNGEHLQKCKYSSFMFDVGTINNEYIKAFVENELTERLAQQKAHP